MEDDEARALIRRLASGDQRALEPLFNSLFGMVDRTLRQLLRNDADREEVINETFHEVWKYADRFEERSTARTWVTSIAINKAKMHLRKQNSIRRAADIAGQSDSAPPNDGRSEVEPTEPTGSSAQEDQGGMGPAAHPARSEHGSASSSPEEGVHQGGFEHVWDLERIEALRRCIAELSARHREVFELRLFEGKTVPEAAEKLRTAEGNVKRQLHEATHQLRGCVHRRGYGAAL